MFWVQPLLYDRRLEVKREPFLYAPHPGSTRQIHKQRQIEGDRSGQDGIPAEEVDLDLHRIAEPAEDIDIVPALFIVPAGRIVIDPDDMGDIAIEIRVPIGREDIAQHPAL